MQYFMIFADTQFWDSIPHGDHLTVTASNWWEAMPKLHSYCYHGS